MHQIKQDLEHNHGLCLIDPHGDLVDAVIENIPESRLDDVVLFDAADSEYPIPFNILHAETELEKTLLASDLVATFPPLLSRSPGDVMDSVLANAILAFVQNSCGETLFELKRFLVEKDFRNEFLETVTDDAVVYFWRTNSLSFTANLSRRFSSDWTHFCARDSSVILFARKHRL